MRRAMARLKQRAVDDEVGVATDGRREVRVFGLGEPVMPERFDGVTGAHERAEKTDLQRRADGNGVELLQELRDFGALGEIAARDVMAEDVLTKFVDAARVRFF